MIVVNIRVARICMDSRRSVSVVATLALLADGAGGVKKLKAKDLLVPVGSRRKEKGPSDKPSFKVPVVHDRNKFTDERG